VWEVRKLLMLIITPGVDSVCFNASRLQHKCSWCSVMAMAVVQHKTTTQWIRALFRNFRCVFASQNSKALTQNGFKTPLLNWHIPYRLSVRCAVAGVGPWPPPPLLRPPRSRQKKWLAVADAHRAVEVGGRSSSMPAVPEAPPSGERSPSTMRV
jgi:hypothetical protein